MEASSTECGNKTEKEKRGIYMKFHLKTAVAGALAFVLMGGGLISQAEENSKSEKKVSGTDRNMSLEHRIPRICDKLEEPFQQAFVLDKLPNGKSRLTLLDEKLTKEEKAQLKRTEEKTAPLYQKIERMEAEVSTITARISGACQVDETELNKLYGRHDALWEKLYQHSTEKEWEMSAEDRIRVSKSLSESEKNTLLRDLKEIAAVEAILAEKNREIARATAELEEEMDQLYDAIWESERKDRAIWDRIYGPSPMPYEDGENVEKMSNQ